MTIRAFKVGGIRFLRLGRYQLSFCRCRPKPRRVVILGTAYSY